jgi:hypothetical protein
MILDSRARRLHASLAYVLLLAAAALVLSATVVPAYGVRRDFAERYAEARARFAQFEEAVAAADAAAEELASGRHSDMNAGEFFVADTNVLAGADLQNRLKALVENRHGEVISMSVRPAEDDAIFPAISVDSSLRCSIAALIDLVRVVEESSPALFIDELSVQSMHQPGRVLPSIDMELEVRITVTGYRFVPQGERS